MAAWYKIVAVESEEPREWSTGEGGKFHAWRVRFANEQGRELGNVELNKKPESPKPTVGSEHYGTVDTQVEHGPKFKYAKVPGGGNAVRGGSGGGGSSSPSQPSSNGSGPAPAGDRGFGWQTNPVDAARMNRAHAQEMAIRFLAAEVEAAVLADAEAPAVSLDEVTRLTDHFEKDVNGAPTKAETEASSTPAPEPTPAEQAPPAQSDAEAFAGGDPGPVEEPVAAGGGDDDIPF